MRKRLAPIGLVLLAACGQSDLYSNVPEKEANEMIVTLGEAGVAARKAPGAEGTFTVSAPGADFAYAMQVLTAADFPRERNDEMKALLQKKGLVSPESEQRLRANALLTENLNATLSAIDGVQVARVHIVSPPKNRFGEAPSEATAAVFIKHRPEADVGAESASIKALVANAVEGLSPSRVSVAFFPASPTPVRGEAPTQALAAEVAAPALGVLGALVVGAGLWRTRRRAPAPLAEIEGPDAAREGEDG